MKNSLSEKKMYQCLKSMNKLFVVAGVFLVVLIFFLSAGVLYFNHQIFTPKELTSDSQEFVVSEGQSVSRTATDLESKGIIRDKNLFLVYWRLKSLKLPLNFLDFYGSSGELSMPQEDTFKTIKAGKYSLSATMTIPEISSKLASGEIKEGSRKVTIPEGFNSYEIDKRLSDKGLIERGEFLSYVQNYWLNFSCPQKGTLRGCSLNLASGFDNEGSSFAGGSLEGYLFPDTYKFSKGVSVEVIVQKLLSNFEERLFGNKDSDFGNYEIVSETYDKLQLGGGSQSSSAKFRDVVTIASIVEKEVQDFQKKREVAGVIYNRLQKQMKLDSCPTVIYAQIVTASSPYSFIETTREHNPVTIMDTEIESQYNTYQNQGLPPTPISNPGLESIQATLNPADTENLYYLSNPAGETLFSKTYSEHLRKKQKFLD